MQIERHSLMKRQKNKKINERKRKREFVSSFREIQQERERTKHVIKEKRKKDEIFFFYAVFSHVAKTTSTRNEKDR